MPTAAVLPDPAAIVAAALAAAQPAVTPTPELALPAPAPAVAPATTPVPPEPESVPPAEPATAAPLEQSPAPPVVAPAPAVPSLEPPAAPVPAPDTPPAPVSAQETVEPVETAVEAVTQAVQQVQRVNVNISVRVDSPGDNGAVAQINAAALAAPPPVAVPPEVRYQAPDPQYRDAPASSGSPPAPDAPAGTAGAESAAAVPTDAWNWTWTWSCGDAIPPSIVLPAEYLQQNWNWNWNWNCGENNNAIENTESQSPSQYQPVTSQYQPINVNISIRIASPGNDGPVVQANVAVALSNLVPVVIRPAPVSVVAPPASTAAAASPAAAPAAAPESSAPPSAVQQDAASPAETPVSETAASDRTPIRSVLELEPTPDGRDTTAATSRTATRAVSPEAIASLAPPAPAVAAGQHAKAQEERRQARTHRSAPAHEQARLVRYASVAPLGAVGADRTLQLIFLILIPFLLAFADAARRVKEEWIAEAADSGRRRRKPG